MAHFVWMIAWILKFLIGDEAPNIYHLSCIEETNGQHITFSTYLPLLHNESYLVYLPKANLYTWEETYPLEALQYPCSCLRTSDILEGRTVISLN